MREWISNLGRKINHAAKSQPLSSTLIFLFCYTLLCPAEGRTAKYAGEPFYLGVGAQALGLGGAFSAAANDVTSGFWNPAGLSLLSEKQLAFMHAETFGSLLNHDYLAFALPIDPQAGRAGAISLTRLGGGGIKITEWDNGEPRVLREESHADYQFILSYAFRIHSKIELGANAKFIYRDIPTSSAYGLGIDLGLRYSPAQWIVTSLVIKDATTTLLAYDTGTKESIFPTVITGISVHKSWKDFRLMLTADGAFQAENLRDAAEFWQGSLSLDTHWGAQLDYRDIIFARGGIDIGRLALGGGVKVSPFQIDFAYLSDRDLDDSFRVSALFFWK